RSPRVRQVAGIRHGHPSHRSDSERGRPPPGPHWERRLPAGSSLFSSPSDAFPPISLARRLRQPSLVAPTQPCRRQHFEMRRYRAPGGHGGPPPLELARKASPAEPSAQLLGTSPRR